MKTELIISDLTPEEAHLISKFADLLSKRNEWIPEPSREPTGRYMLLHAEENDKVERIITILNEEVSRGSERCHDIT